MRKAVKAQIFLSLVLAGCAVGPDYERPEAPAPAKYKEAGPWQAARPSDTAPRGEWWKVFRDPALPKGAVNLNVEAGRVVLRGEVADPALVEELERRVRDVVGVREVENLLHPPGADVPEHVARPR